MYTIRKIPKISTVHDEYSYHCPSTYYDWQTPAFIQIRKKKTKRTSPYLETELWEREELLCVLKYEPSKRNKAALALFWDLDARNHEVTLLKIKHIRLKERYGEGDTRLLVYISKEKIQEIVGDLISGIFIIITQLC